MCEPSGELSAAACLAESVRIAYLRTYATYALKEAVEWRVACNGLLVGKARALVVSVRRRTGILGTYSVWHTSAFVVRICQHMSAYVSIRQHTSAYVVTLSVCRPVCVMVPDLAEVEVEAREGFSSFTSMFDSNTFAS